MRSSLIQGISSYAKGESPNTAQDTERRTAHNHRIVTRKQDATCESTNHGNLFFTTLGGNPQWGWRLRYSFTVNANSQTMRATAFEAAG